MTVLICENCGATNQRTVETLIDKLTVKVLNNGSDNGSFELATEACQNCRKVLMDAIKHLLTTKINTIEVTLKK